MDLQADLLRQQAYGALHPTRVDLVETHISWVFLIDREVFKVKKPIDLGFLDFRSTEQRKIACDAEVKLNGRLAPEVYRGVVAIRRGDGGHCVIGGDGPLVDWAVHMVRLADDKRADLLLERGELSGDAIDTVATRIAAFHASARMDERATRFGTADAIERNIQENFAQTSGRVDEYVDPELSEEIARWQTAFVRGHAALFEQRVAAGRVRDGHGDLRLEHIYLLPSAGPTVIDCIEFNDRFRFGDVCADIAFLSMDLAAHQRVDLAERLLARYAREANDFDLYALVDFYESYRAYVRGKIATILAADDRLDPAVRQRAERDARECRADPSVRRSRLTARAGERGVSDGRLESADAFRARFEPVDELAPDDHLVLDTGRPLDESVAALRARLDAWPPGLVG